MEYKADALLLRSVNWGESDKIVTLLTADGKVGAAMKGVRKAGAKLNFASQPFCFAEYVLVTRGNRRTVIEASLHDGFYGLRTDLMRLYAAASVTEVCDAFALEEMPCGPLLVAAVEALESIETENREPMSAVLAFFLRALAFAGYPVSAGNCPHCGKKIVGRCHFDMDNGAFGCSDCAEGVLASEVTYRAVRYFLARRDETKDGAPMSEETPSFDGIIRAIRLLRTYIAHQTECDLRATDDLLALV